ncbi:MAG TPA: hypothetical protein DCY79_04190 [Planctomycetaceae bacterium]|nr:hypothetical protein [Blastopirellula sp.]HAY78985.1 hypothetical protein [Planctomycetaceae bacterium]
MRKLSIVTLCVGVATTFHALSLLAQEPGDASRPANLPMPAAAEEGKETHQLPDGYGAVVTRGQRRRIYGIQDQYQGEIDKLQRQINLLLRQREQEIARILDDEQRRIIAYILKLRADEREQEASAEGGTVPGADAAADSVRQATRIVPDPMSE